MHLQTSGCSYGAQLRTSYKRYCLPCEELLVRAVEDAYDRIGLNSESIDPQHGEDQTLTTTTRSTLDEGDVENYHVESRVVTRHSTGPRAVAEEKLPEATQAAVKARMNAESLEECERTHKLFAPFSRPSAKQLDVRNHILRQWYRNVTVRLTVYRALCQIPAVYYNLAVAVYTYLEVHGMINFGALDVQTPIASYLSGLNRCYNKKNVAIIGAGVAGLCAARHLQSYGIGVTIHEARARVGGRAYTDVNTFSAPVDLGAMIITGVTQNPVAIVAKQVGAELVDLKAKCPIMDVDGKWVSADLDNWAEKEFNAILESTAQYRKRAARDPIAQAMSLGEAFQCALEQRARKRVAFKYKARQACPALELRRSRFGVIAKSHSLQKPDFDRHAAALSRVLPSSVNRKPNASLLGRLLRWHIANLENACAADIFTVSLMHWDQDDPYGFSGEDQLLRSGFQVLLAGLTAGISRGIRVESCIRKISRCFPGRASCPVRVTSERRGLVQTDDYTAVIVTVPLGVLKSDMIEFDPILPAVKRNAIDRLGIGGLVKVVLEFSKSFWDGESMFGALNDAIEFRGRFYLFLHLDYCVERPILMTLVSEPAVESVENMEDTDIVHGVMETLRRVHHSAPNPVAYTVTRWSSDPFSRGVYSFIPVGCTGADYDLLAEPVDDCIYFAGEHTCRRYPTTTASALLSGYQAAYSVIDSFGMLEDINAYYTSSLRLGLRNHACSPTNSKSLLPGVPRREAYVTAVRGSGSRRAVVRFDSEKLLTDHKTLEMTRLRSGSKG
jgi:monoamine oxidase